MMLPLLLGIALAGDVVVFGDSWGEGGGTPLQQELNAASLGLSVSNHAIGGTTAAYWNTQPGAFAAAVTANPNARWVWLSILGNDTFAHHAASEGQHAASRNEANLRTMLDGLFAVHPNIEVVLFAYDYVNFEMSTECLLSAAIYFPQLLSSNSFTTAAVNQIFVRDVYDVQVAVAADYPQVTVYNIFGTLQLDAGTLGAPNPLLPSPASRMSDCIHPTQAGYRVLHRELVSRYWLAPAPSAAISGPSHVCLGEEASLVSTSQQASRTSWYLDGAFEQDASTFRFTPTEPSTEVRLEARNGAWKDVATRTITTSSRPDVPILSDLTICAGEEVVLDAGPGPATWGPSSEVSDPTSSNPTVQPSRTTTYTATVGEVGCSVQATQRIVVLPSPTTAIAGDAVVEVGRTYPYRITGDGVDPTWHAEGGEISLTEDPREVRVVWRDPGVRTLEVTTAHDTSACTRTVTLEVEAFEQGAMPDPGADGTGGRNDPHDDWNTPRTNECGCSAGGSSPAWLGLLGMGLLATRRRGDQLPASSSTSR